MSYRSSIEEFDKAIVAENMRLKAKLAELLGESTTEEDREEMDLGGVGRSECKECDGMTAKKLFEMDDEAEFETDPTQKVTEDAMISLNDFLGNADGGEGGTGPEADGDEEAPAPVDDEEVPPADDSSTEEPPAEEPASEEPPPEEPAPEAPPATDDGQEEVAETDQGVQPSTLFEAEDNRQHTMEFCETCGDVNEGGTSSPKEQGDDEEEPRDPKNVNVEEPVEKEPVEDVPVEPDEKKYVGDEDDEQEELEESLEAIKMFARAARRARR